MNLLVAEITDQLLEGNAVPVAFVRGRCVSRIRGQFAQDYGLFQTLGAEIKKQVRKYDQQVHLVIDDGRLCWATRGRTM